MSREYRGDGIDDLAARFDRALDYSDPVESNSCTLITARSCIVKARPGRYQISTIISGMVLVGPRSKMVKQDKKD